jgi:hypothetical protein
MAVDNKNAIQGFFSLAFFSGGESKLPGNEICSLPSIITSACWAYIGEMIPTNNTDTIRRYMYFPRQVGTMQGRQFPAVRTGMFYME